jgi:hypothetical protein
LRLRICCLASGSCSIGPRRPGARVSRSAPKTTAGSLGGRVAIQVAPTIDPNSNARHTIASPPSNRFARIATAQDAAAIHNATTRDVGTVRMSYRLNTGGRRRPQPARTGLFVAAGHGLQRCGLQTGIFDRQQWHNADAPGELQGCSQSNLRYRQMATPTTPIAAADMVKSPCRNSNMALPAKVGPRPKKQSLPRPWSRRADQRA